jgi:hypothetical protein
VILEFGLLWQLALSAPVGLYGVANAAVLSAGGAGSWLSARLTLAKPATIVGIAGLLVGSSLALVLMRNALVVILAQVVLAAGGVRDQHGLYPLAARLTLLTGASGSSICGGSPLLIRLCAFCADLWNGEPTRRHLSRRVDGSWGGAACQHAAGQSGCGPRFRFLKDITCNLQVKMLSSTRIRKDVRNK